MLYFFASARDDVGRGRICQMLPRWTKLMILYQITKRYLGRFTFVVCIGDGIRLVYFKSISRVVIIWVDNLFSDCLLQPSLRTNDMHNEANFGKFYSGTIKLAHLSMFCTMNTTVPVLWLCQKSVGNESVFWLSAQHLTNKGILDW